MYYSDDYVRVYHVFLYAESLLFFHREFKKGGTERALFVAKTPFNKDQLEFEVEIKELSSKKLFAIGVCHSTYPVNQFLGWKQGSVGYHADNGR